MTGTQVVSALADLADIDPILVPAPSAVHLVSGDELAGLLPRLEAIEGARSGHGAHLRVPLRDWAFIPCEWFELAWPCE
jgi:hypothetical protein